VGLVVADNTGPVEFRVARGCLYISAALLALTTFGTLWFYQEGDTTMRVAVMALCGALIFGGLTASLDWVRGKQYHSIEKQPAETLELSVGRSLTMGRDNANRSTLRTMYLSGWNGTKNAIGLESAKVVSGTTGEVQELKIPVMENNHWISIPVTDATLIPPNARFVLQLDFTENGSDGLTQDEALRRWGVGYFEVRHSGKTVNVSFDEANLNRAFDDARPRPEPHVSRKQ